MKDTLGALSKCLSQIAEGWQMRDEVGGMNNT